MPHRRSDESTINRDWLRPGDEPALADLYTDPLFLLLLRREGLTLADVQRVVARAQVLLRSGECRCAA